MGIASVDDDGVAGEGVEHVGEVAARFGAGLLNVAAVADGLAEVVDHFRLDAVFFCSGEIGLAEEVVAPGVVDQI